MTIEGAKNEVNGSDEGHNDVESAVETAEKDDEGIIDDR